ncbi:MAG: hypothetical protein ACJATA_000374 [Sphingobacteriales bacterium]|jgi:hypothetical protein
MRVFSWGRNYIGKIMKFRKKKITVNPPISKENPPKPKKSPSFEGLHLFIV